MQEINLQYAPVSVRPVVHVSQFDDGRQFKLLLYDGISPVTPESGSEIRIEGIKPDRKGFSFTDAVSISGNIVTVTTKKQMTCVAGRVECEIRFSKGEKDIGSLNFDMMVERSPINEGVDISETVLPAIFTLATEQMLTAEAYAKGTRNGVPVTSDQAGYNDNSKYYKNLAKTHETNAATSAASAIDSASSASTNALKSEGYAIGTQNGTAVSGGTYYQNNSKYYSELSSDAADDAHDSATAALLSEQNAKTSEGILSYYTSFVIPRFQIVNNRVYLSDPAVGEFATSNNRLYIKNGTP